ncbi:MAG: DUF423 domain-containing protein [Sulfobacillus thermotolerans]|nr:DUF423 domain-containing protein [Sulfobacillus thermotolerans]
MASLFVRNFKILSMKSQRKTFVKHGSARYHKMMATIDNGGRDHTMFLSLGAVMALLGVALGAFGAHALRAKLDEKSLANYQTGVQYQMYHALGLLVTGLVSIKAPDTTLLAWAGWLFVVGIVLFSGSLYVLSITGRRKWGMVTPFGGLAFIVAWAMLAAAGWKVA